MMDPVADAAASPLSAAPLSEPVPLETGSRRAVLSWCFYDWANSAYAALIQTFVFATYFTRAVIADPVEGTAAWGHMVTISALFIAVLSPMLGAITDRNGHTKRWLLGVTTINVAATAALWWIAPSRDFALAALLLAGIGTVAFEISNVLYNALLPTVAPPERLGRVSGLGWGLGYAGGLVCLMVALLGLVMADPPPFGLASVQAGPVRATTLLTALWMAIFALPLFLFVPEVRRRGESLGQALREGMADVVKLARQVAGMKRTARFLIANMIYTDGLVTLFSFGAIFAAGTFGLGETEVLVFGIGLNITAGLGCLAFALLDRRFGTLGTIRLSLVALILLGTATLLAPSKELFWGAALALGLFFGPLQAASRTRMAELAPEGMTTRLYGLLALSGRATAFAGPLLLAQVTLATGSQRAGLGTCILFFAIGLFLLRGRKG